MNDAHPAVANSVLELNILGLHGEGPYTGAGLEKNSLSRLGGDCVPKVGSRVQACAIRKEASGLAGGSDTLRAMRVMAAPGGSFEAFSSEAR